MTWKSALSSLLVLAATCGTASAAPFQPQAGLTLGHQPSNVTEVQWRRHGGGWGWGLPWLGAGIIAGAIIADQAYRPHPGHYYDEGPYDGPYYYPADYHGDPRTVCAQNFRSFEWRTGLYTTYSGEKRLCPYLRQ